MLAQFSHSPAQFRLRPLQLLLAAIVAIVIVLAAVAASGVIWPAPTATQPAPVSGAWVSETSSTRSPSLIEPLNSPAETEEPAARTAIEPALAPLAGAPASTDATVVAVAPNIVLVDSESWDAASAAAIDQALALLPASVQTQLGNPALGPIKIVVSRDGSTPSGYQPYGGAANFFSTNEGDNVLVLYPGQGVLTVLHELGHAYNLRDQASGNYAAVLLQPEMQSFLAAAGWRVLTPATQLATIRDQAAVSYAYDGEPIWDNLSHNDPLEDFANSFARYFAAPRGLQSLSPARYAWFAERFGF